MGPCILYKNIQTHQRSIARYKGLLNIFINTKGTVLQPRVLQLNFDNINQLPHSKYPDRKIGEFAYAGIETTTFCVLGRHPNH